jgi:hypothetical protein
MSLALGLALSVPFFGLLVAAVMLARRARSALKRHLSKVAGELGLVPGMNQADFYYGTIQGWPVRLSIEEANILPAGSPLRVALLTIGMVELFGSPKNATTKVVVLEICGHDRPRELDQLVATGGGWRKDLAPWQVVIAGDSTIRWVQILEAEQKELRGEHVLTLLAMTLGLDPS